MKRTYGVGPFFLVLCGVALAIGVTACHGKDPSKRAGTGTSSETVRVDPVRSENADRTSYVTGVVQGRHEATVKSLVMGRVFRMTARLGQNVPAGTVLAEISGGTEAASAEAADAVASESEKVFLRIDTLYKSQSATKAEWDAARRALDVAQADAKRAHAVLEHTRVSAPFAGSITRKFVRQGDTVVVGTPIFRIVQMGGFQVVAHVPDRWASSVKPGQKLVFAVRKDGAVRGYKTVVRERSSQSDPESHTVTVKADLADAVPHVWSGLFGTLEVPIGRETALFIPSASVVDSDGLKEVYVVTGGKAYLRYVRTGRTLDGRTEILSGLSVGEDVVVGPSGTLANGVSVRIEERQ